MICNLCKGIGSFLDMIDSRPAFWNCPKCGGSGCSVLFCNPILKIKTRRMVGGDKPNCFVSKSGEQDIKNLFLETDKIHIFEENFDFGSLAVIAGFFDSKNQARKNGWDGKIPKGWGSKKFGKQKIEVFWWNV
jgi:hypothetical protein